LLSRGVFFSESLNFKTRARFGQKGLKRAHREMLSATKKIEEVISKNWKGRYNLNRPRIQVEGQSDKINPTGKSHGFFCCLWPPT